MNGQSNVDRLVDAGIIDATNLNQAGQDAINQMDLTDVEIDKLKSFKQKLDLDAIPLEGPEMSQGQRIGIWHL